MRVRIEGVGSVTEVRIYRDNGDLVASVTDSDGGPYDVNIAGEVWTLAYNEEEK